MMAKTGREPGVPQSIASKVATPAAVILMLFACIHAGSSMHQVVDTWVGLAAGRFIASAGVGGRDPFSFHSRGSSSLAAGQGDASATRFAESINPSGWINQNWLSHLITYRLQKAFGYGALVVLRLALCAAVGLSLFLAQRVLGVSTLAAATAVVVAMVSLRGLVEIRAQDFTNSLVAAELLVLALALTRSSRWRWLVPVQLILWSNLHGGFLYGFVILAVMGAASSLRGSSPSSGGEPLSRLWLRLAALAAVAVAGIVIISPYHLANFIHPLVLGKASESWLWRNVEEWQPVFAGGLGGREARHFLTLLAALAGAGLLAFVRRPRRGSPSRDGAAGTMATNRSRFQLGLLILLALGIALTLSSQRFLALASITGAPIIGLWLDQGLSAGQRRSGGQRSGHLAGARVRREAVVGVMVAFGGAALVAYWCWRVYLAYVSAWPHSAVHTSVFARMTWMHSRGEDVCQFMRDNSISGRAFNFWVDGGYLAWCQAPDPVTGKIPLQIFIDGRAQAAYNAEVHQDYLLLLAGGPHGMSLLARGRAADARDLTAMRSWVERRLRDERIELALVPSGESTGGLAQALFASDAWKLVFLGQTHMLLADTATPQGERLYARVRGGTAVFPDDFSVNITGAYDLWRYGGTQAAAATSLAAAQRAFRARPCALAVDMVRRAGGSPALRASAEAFLLEIERGAREQPSRFLAEDGFMGRLEAAILATAWLEENAPPPNLAAGEQRRQLISQLREVAQEAWRRSVW